MFIGCIFFVAVTFCESVSHLSPAITIYRGFCILLVADNVGSWYEAHFTCASGEGVLISLVSEEETEFIKNVIKMFHETSKEDTDSGWLVGAARNMFNWEDDS